MHIPHIQAHLTFPRKPPLSRARDNQAVNIGTRIKDARKRGNIPIAEIAKAAGVSKQAVYQWESGETRALKGEHLVEVARVLRVDPTWLASGKGRREGAHREPDLTDEAIELARAWQKLDPATRNSFRDVIFYLAATQSVAAWLQIARPRSPKYDAWEQAIQSAYDAEIKQLRLDLGE